eukprot:GHVU01151897.1.p1 GENE.GHVU01151897.1~~GHVU01151897.1.p1  ORF type:complete len:130 (+),score=9.66 GHVU01151897.1:97-486(+)
MKRRQIRRSNGKQSHDRFQVLSQIRCRSKSAYSAPASPEDNSPERFQQVRQHAKNLSDLTSKNENVTEPTNSTAFENQGPEQTNITIGQSISLGGNLKFQASQVPESSGHITGDHAPTWRSDGPLVGIF